MDENRLKGRPPFPFETIAVAVAFSPRLDALLCEACRLAETFGARLVMIHVGRFTPDKEAILLEKCANAGISQKAEIVWRDGDPVTALLESCKAHMVDLLVLGALQRESMFRYYLGSVARSLSRKAKCSLLLLTEPKRAGSTFRRIVVGCTENPKTLPTLKTVLYFARQAGSAEIQVVKEVDQAGLAMAMSDDSTTDERIQVREQLFLEAEENLREKISLCDTDGMVIVSTVLFGRPGFVLRKFAKERGADLLVLNSPDGRYGLINRLFPHDMEFILEDLPCNVLIVHSRQADSG